MGVNCCVCEDSDTARTMPTLPQKGLDESDIEINPTTSQLQEAKSQIAFFREELQRMREEKKRTKRVG